MITWPKMGIAVPKTHCPNHIAYVLRLRSFVAQGGLNLQNAITQKTEKHSTNGTTKVGTADTKEFDYLHDTGRYTVVFASLDRWLPLVEGTLPWPFRGGMVG